VRLRRGLSFGGLRTGFLLQAEDRRSICRLTITGHGPNQGATASALRPGGRLAQLVERLVYTEDVGGSSPSSPTIQFPTPFRIICKQLSSMLASRVETRFLCVTSKNAG
jgi:hypothetical protein